jgi:hypothetical protein
LTPTALAGDVMRPDDEFDKAMLSRSKVRTVAMGTLRAEGGGLQAVGVACSYATQRLEAKAAAVKTMLRKVGAALARERDALREAARKTRLVVAKRGVGDRSLGERLKEMRRRERDTFTFAKSGIHGWGLVALRDVAADTFVTEYRGDVVRRCVADVRERAYKVRERDREREGERGIEREAESGIERERERERESEREREGEREKQREG